MEFGMGSIFRAQLRGWWVYFIFMFLFVGVALLFSTLPKKYQASMSVTAVQQTADVGGGAGVTGSPLAFLNGGMSEKITNFQMYLNLLRGREVAKAIMEQPDLLRALMESRWDEETQSWRPGTNAMDGWFDYEVPSQPIVDDVIKALDQNIKIEQKSTPEAVPAPIFDISISLPDREAGLRILQVVHERSDELVRQNELVHLQAWQDFLQNRIYESSVTEARNALSQIYSNFYTRRIIADSDGYFAAQFIAPPSVSFYPVLPRPMSLVMIAIVMSIIVSFAFNFGRYCLQNLGRRS